MYLRSPQERTALLHAALSPFLGPFKLAWLVLLVLLRQAPSETRCIRIHTWALLSGTQQTGGIAADADSRQQLPDKPGNLKARWRLNAAS